ncbi:AmmeMemoRadiSam system protein A [Sansalvadorimonas sp. 2012CJ34-2]|uniref:AmmeMemoRadiSam system protein A n=1 Tax=Parendozoicomonas callyspongiae TaxID=2942213 RepID=A0ABT0PGZ9_9GAMM|nr:AmmeMemoRadiSam system protein A [Sansalvadorimonas sp. 2012CJ34-2]MCL6270531.1 AmmeMemoRadiSam system protein A [Sansalvadorimonas sp. 2012CJ34-2]
MYSEQEQKTLLSLARQTILQGCQDDNLSSISGELNSDEVPSSFNEVRACFVTLHKNGELRGCIGSLEPHRTLQDDVISNAWSAAFRDPRFPQVSEDEVSQLDLEISILSPVEPFPVSSEEELLRKLVPFRDGLIIDDGRGHRATFLPQVWEQLPQPQQFLNHLKRKAGLAIEEWPKSLKCFKYHCEAFSE